MSLPAGLPERLAHLVVHRSRIIILAALVLLGGCLWLVSSKQRLDSEILNLFPQNTETVRGLKVFNAEFRQGRELLLMLDGSPEAIAEVEEDFLQRLRAQPWVERVFAGSPMEDPEELRALQAIVPQLLLNLDPAAFAKAAQALTPAALEERVTRLKAALESGSPRAELEASVDPLGLVGFALAPMNGDHSMQKGQNLGAEDGSMKLYPVVARQASLSQADCQALMIEVDRFREETRKSWSGKNPPQILVTGRAAYVAQIAASMQRDVLVTSLISMITVTGLFLVGFRRILPPVGTTIILSFSCFVAFTAGCVLFTNLNMIAIAFCSILLGLGDDFSLLLYNRYLLARRHGEDHERGVATSIREVSGGILWVALTTSVGFLALLFSGSPGFAQLGALIAIGLVLCAVFVIGLLFVFIRPGHAHPERPDPLHRPFAHLVTLLLHLPGRVGWPMLAIALAACLYAVLPIHPLRLDTNPRSLEPKTIPAARALQRMNDKIAPTPEPVMLLVDAPDQESAYRSWKTVDAHLRQLVADGTLASFSSPFAFTLSPQQIEANRLTLQRTVDLAASEAAYRRALEASGFSADAFQSAFDLFAKLRAADAATARLDLASQLPAQSAWWFLIDRYQSLRPNLAAAYLRPATPLETPEQQAVFERAVRACDAPVQITGWSYAMISMVTWARAELRIFTLAVGSLILLLLAIAYRDWRPLLIHALSLVFAVGLCLTLLKLTGTRVNLLNALAFPLMLGVGVDYGMHLILALREGHVAENLTTVLKPVVISGLTTIAGFGALMAAQNPALKGLGTVCALGVLSCLLSSIFFAVPMMVLLDGKKHAPPAA